MEGEGNRQCNGEHCFTFIIYSTLVNVGFGHGSYFTDGNLYPFLIKNTEKVTVSCLTVFKHNFVGTFFLLLKHCRRSHHPSPLNPRT